MTLCVYTGMNYDIETFFPFSPREKIKYWADIKR